MSVWKGEVLGMLDRGMRITAVGYQYGINKSPVCFIKENENHVGGVLSRVLHQV
jgi:hypothetical protein